jgi:hypothetical protein
VLALEKASIPQPERLGRLQGQLAYTDRGVTTVTLALYCFEPVHDVVLILAIRHRREAGHAGDA